MPQFQTYYKIQVGLLQLGSNDCQPDGGQKHLKEALGRGSKKEAFFVDSMSLKRSKLPFEHRSRRQKNI